MHSAVVGDPDVWWHLRTGEWINQNHAFPRVDYFTTFGAGKPWAAYSWAFELLLFGLFRSFGLYGIVLYTSTMILAITIALHRLVKLSAGDTPIAASMTFLACFSMAHLYTPRPWLLTIFFFTVELHAILSFRQTRKIRSIILMPIMFAPWANVHIQFINGLLVLGLACADEIWNVIRQRATFSRSTRTFLYITLLCFIATLANPYGIHIYHVAHQLAAQSGVLNSLQELQAIPFRNIVDWTALALGVASITRLSRHRRPPLFNCVILAFSIVLAFRSQRDVWMLAIVSAATITLPECLSERPSTPTLRHLTPVLAGSALLLLFAAGACMGTTQSSLQKRLTVTLPVSASNYVRESGYPGPIFNGYGWGGYLIWSLHRPVCIDGRASFMGDARIAASVSTWTGESDWARNPDLASSNLVLGERNAPLTQLLRESPEFRLVYEDDLAVVFARRHLSLLKGNSN